MLKKIIYLVIIVVVVLISTIFSFYLYQKNKAANSLIPSNTNWVVQINGTAFIKDNWYDLLQSKSSDKDTTLLSLFDLPVYIYLFNLVDAPNQIHTILPMKKNVDFNNFMEGLNWVRVKEWKWVNDNMAVEKIGSQILCTYNILKQPIEYEISSKDLVPINETIYKKLLDNNKLIAGISATNNGFELDFQKGKIEIEGNVITTSNQKLQTVVPMPNAYAFFNFPIAVKDIPYINTLFDKEEGEQKLFDFINGNSFPLFALIDSSFVYQDTIISYKYDDNFNKSEVQSVQTIQVPSLVMQFEKIDNVAIDSFKNGAFLKKQLLPMYPFKLYQTNVNNVTLATIDSFSFQTDSTNQLKNIFIDFSKLLKHFNSLNRFEIIQSLHSFNLHCTPTSDGYNFNGVLLLNNTNLQSSSLLFRAL